MPVMVDFKLMAELIPKEVYSLIRKWRRMAHINQTSLVLHSVDSDIMNFVYDAFDQIIASDGTELK